MRYIFLIAIAYFLITVGCNRDGSEQYVAKDKREAQRKTPKEMEELSKELKIEALHDVSLTSDETEVRIWHADGITMPNCLILHRKVGENWATFVFRDGNGVKETSMERPRSSHDAVWNMLESLGLGYPISAGEKDTERIMYRDAPNTIIEIKSGSDYDNRFFREHEDTYYGPKMRDLWRLSVSEFGTSGSMSADR